MLKYFDENVNKIDQQYIVYRFFLNCTSCFAGLRGHGHKTSAGHVIIKMHKIAFS